MITASLTNYRQSPRKVRSVANLVRGKSVEQALQTLHFISKKAGNPLHDLLMSALANAKHNFNIEKENLIIKELRVDAGQVMKRSMPRARGSSSPIHKRNSHVMLILAPKAEKGVQEVKAIEKPQKEVVKAEKKSPKTKK